jgi:DNA-binding response OmpR family regulator
MPGRSGDEVLEAVRERGVHTRVVMVTAIDPDLEIVDLPFDDYLCKPVERADLRVVVDQQCRVLAYELLGEYFRLESRRAVIEAELPPGRLADHEEFGELERRTERLRERVVRLLPGAEELLADFSGIDREGY